MQEIKSWTAVYKNPLTGMEIKTAVYAPDRDAATAKAEANNITAGPYGPPWEILSVTETVFPDASPEKPPSMYQKHDDGIRTEIFYDRDEALDCLAAHPGADIHAHGGHPIILNGRMTYDIPENRPHWTIVWDEPPQKPDRSDF